MIRGLPPSEIPKRPVSAALALMAAVLMLAKLRGYSLDALSDDRAMFWAQPWRLFTSCLVHRDVIHLGFNLYWLWLIGARLEAGLGSFRMLGLVLLFAVGSDLAEYALFQGGIGLSGVGYGLVAMAYVLSRRDPRFADAMDRQTAQLFTGWFFLCIVLDASGLYPVANAAHAGGAILGALAGLAASSGVARARRLAAAVATAVVLGAFLLGATRLRRRVNFTDAPYWDEIAWGNRALDAGAVDDATRHYRAAVAIDARKSAGWFNLGIALERGKSGGARDAYEKALAIEPDEAKYRNAVADALAKEAFGRDVPDEQKIALYGRVVQLEPGEPSSWYNLGRAHERRHHDDEALAAYERALALAPSDADYRRAVASSLFARAYAMGDTRWDDQLALYRRAVTLDDSSAATWFNLGVAHERLGHGDEARAAFDRAAALEPNDPRYLVPPR